MNIQTATPVEIDTVLADLYGKDFYLRLESQRLTEWAHDAAGDRIGWSNKTYRLSHTEAWDKVAEIASTDKTYVGKNAQDLLAKRDANRAARGANATEQAPLHAEYMRRGGWTRGFLVTDGHLHRSMNCSTCFPTTQFAWLPEVSGKDEIEIVEMAGERACTVCYPAAPTMRSFQKASVFFTEEERARDAARDERAAAKAVRDAKRIAAALTPDGSEFTVEYPGFREGATSREHFKTERAAVIWATDALAWSNPERKANAVRSIAEAVAAKNGRTVEDVMAEFEKKAAKKRG